MKIKKNFNEINKKKINEKIISIINQYYLKIFLNEKALLCQ